MYEQYNAQQVIKRISELRDVGRRLARAGYRAGLHNKDPDEVSSDSPLTVREGQDAWGVEKDER